MWKFDPDDYMKRVFSPAADAFAREGGRLPDVFERYDLPLDVSAAADIEAAVRTVTDFWNKRKNNPKYGKLVSRLTDEAGPGGSKDLRSLTDAEARKQLRAEAEPERRKRQEARFEELKSSVSGIAAKGYVTPKEKAELVARFLKAGFSAAEIESHIRVPEREVGTKLPTEQGLDQVIRNQLRTNLATLRKRDLYEFLDLKSNAAPDEIKRRHGELYAEWARKQNDFSKTAAQALLGIVQSHLFGGFAKYEAARVYDLLERLRPEVRLMAADKRISREEFNHLLELATRLGLEKSRATDYILALAEECGTAIEWATGEETISCANCSATSPRRAEKCRACGSDLWADCPKCKTRVAISEAACGKCGFLIANLPRVRLLIRQAQLALEDGATADALKHAREAERLWGRHHEVAELLSRIESSQREAEEIRRRLEEALASASLFAARQALTELTRAAPRYVGHDGKTLVQIRAELDGGLARVEALLRRAHEHEQARRADEAVFAFLEALGVAADAEEARSGLLRYPPEPPQGVRATAHDDHILVEWSPSRAVGNLEYVVVRREGRAPAVPDDGERVALTTVLSCRDAAARPGRLAFYSVFTQRGGTASRAAASGALLVTREVSNFRLAAGDGAVRGSWDFDVPEGRVRVYCREGTVPERGAGREVPLSGPHGFSDSQVENGRLYYYRAVVEYRDAGGKPVFTPGLVQSVKPELPPKPVEHMVVTFEGGVLNLNWNPPPHGKVTVYRAARQPEWKSGTQVPMSSVGGLGLHLQNKSDSQAVDASPPAAPAFYVPVSVAGDIAVIGAARRFVLLPDVTNLSAEDFGHYLLLRWHWPDGCQSALVAWRSDAPPQDAYDPRAAKRKISRGEYEREGGFRVESPAGTAYRFAVFAASEAGAETVYSPAVSAGSRAELRTARPIALSYTLVRGRLRRSRFTLTLTAESAVGSLPELIVVAKRGDIQPLRADDGAVVASLGGTSLPADMKVPFEFQLDGVRPPVYLRAFFREPGSYQSYRLIDPPPEQLRVR